MKKILCIIRTSTIQQELDSQHDEMEAYCHQLGYNNIIWKESKGASARSLNKAYLELLEDVKTTIVRDSDIKAVAVWHLNRLGRREKKLIEMKLWFIEHSINLYVKNPSLQLFDQDGKLRQTDSMFINMLAVSIEIDTEELMEKTKRGKNRNKEIGKWNGGAFGTLLGYRVKEDGFIEIDPEESKLVTDIFNMYASGKYSYQTLAKELRDRGISAKGRKITDNLVRKTLHNEFYRTGTARFKPFISDEIWDKVDCQTKANTTSQPKSKHIFLALKILKCPHCGYNYTTGNSTYACYKKAKPSRFEDKCPSPVIARDVMDNILIYVARMYHIDYLSKVDKEALKKEEENMQILHSKQKAAEEEIAKLKQSLDRLKNLYVEGDITHEGYSDKAETIKSRQKALNESRQAYIIEQGATAGRIFAIKNPSPENFIEICNSLQREENKEVLRDIIRQHIKEAYLEKCTKDGKMCIKITVIGYNGGKNIFYYYYQFTKNDVYTEEGDRLQYLM